MSEQAKILEEMQELIMSIIKTGTATPEQGQRIDELEALLHEQKCYREINHPEHSCQGEEIASLLFNGNKTQAIEKMLEWEITSDDFFGFIQYHDEDEEFTDVFTEVFMADVNEAYRLEYQAK